MTHLLTRSRSLAAWLGCAVMFALPAHAGSVTKIFAGDGTDQTAAVSALLSHDGSYVFRGTLKTGAISVAGKHLTVDFADGATLKPASKTDVLWSFTDSDLTLRHFRVDGQGMAQTALKETNGTLHAANIGITDMGYPADAATAIVTGVWLDKVKSVKIDRAAFSNFHSIGNGIYGDALGEVRGIYAAGTGWIEIGQFEMSGGDGIEDNDYFHAQLGTQGGVIHTLVARYNGNTRRVFKQQSGSWKLENVDIRKGADFVADNAATEAGTHTLNAIDFATSAPGTLEVVAGYMDCSGFPVCVADSGGKAQVKTDANLTMQGSTLKVIRNDAETRSVKNQNSIGFYSSPADIGSGIDGSTLIHFGTGAALQGSQSFARNAIFIDPVEFAAEIGFSKASEGQEFTDNQVITRTPGYVNKGRIVRVFNVANVKLLNNRLIEDGNTTHAKKFIDCTDANATGAAAGNTAPSGTAAMVTGASSVAR